MMGLMSRMRFVLTYAVVYCFIFTLSLPMLSITKRLKYCMVDSVLMKKNKHMVTHRGCMAGWLRIKFIFWFIFGNDSFGMISFSYSFFYKSKIDFIEIISCSEKFNVNTKFKRDQNH